MSTKPVIKQEYKNNAERLAAIKRLARSTNTKTGIEGITIGSDDEPIKRASFGIEELDRKTGGGIPHGAVSIVWGEPGCLAKTTKVPFLSKTINGNFKEKKNQTIERLYRVFNNVSTSGKGKYIRSESVGVDYYLPSVNEDNQIFNNKILDVIYSGKKQVYKLSTNDNQIIYATEDHKFLTPNGYISLKDLRPNDIIYFYPKKLFGQGKTKVKRYVQISVKYHPSESWHTVDKKYKYCKIAQSHMVVEAKLNNMSTEKYRKFLNTETKEKIRALKTINRKTHEVHHIDKCRYNDVIENLQLLTKEDHYLIHNQESIKHITFKVKETCIKCITKDTITDTYDISMESPHNNFIANGLVVHNSTKTTLALSLAAKAQKEGKLVAWAALETFDEARAKKLGVNLDEMPRLQFPKAEQVLDVMIQYAQEKLVDVFILDSIHSLSPKGQQEDSKGEKSMEDNTMGVLARKLSEFFPRFSDPMKRSNMAVLLIGQTRIKIGFICIEALTGGNALHHAGRLIVRVRRGAKDDAPFKEQTINGKKEKTQIGFNTVFKFDKVQVSGCEPEQTTFGLPFYYESEFNLPPALQAEVDAEEAEIAAQEEVVRKQINGKKTTQKESIPVVETEVLEDISVDTVKTEVVKNQPIKDSEPVKKGRGRPRIKK